MILYLTVELSSRDGLETGVGHSSRTHTRGDPLLAVLLRSTAKAEAEAADSGSVFGPERVTPIPSVLVLALAPHVWYPVPRCCSA